MGKGRGKGRANLEGLDPESPRTLEACLHRGITLAELEPRDERSFVRGTESQEFTSRRYDFFEKRRQDKLALVKSRRDELVRKSQAGHEGAGGLSTGEKRALAEAAQQQAATIELERKRVEAIKRKQQQEIERIIDKERVETNMQAHLKHIQELEAEKAERHADMKEKRRQKVEAKKKEIQDRNAQKIADEEHIQKEIERKARAVAAKLEAVRMETESRIKEEAAIRDAARAEKVQVKLRKSQAILKEIERKGELSRLKAIEKEKRIQEILEVKRVKKKEEIRIARERAEKRIAAALEANKAKQRRKREVFDAKQVEVEIRKKEAQEEEKLKIVKDIERGLKAQEEVQERVNYAASIRAERRQKYIDERLHKEKFYGTVRAERLTKVAKAKLESELDEVARLENCERIKRMHEFHRLQLMQKTQKDDLRTMQIKATRNQLVETRKRNAWESFMRKAHIREAMDQMKITGKFVSLDDIIDPGGDRESFSDGED